MDSFFKIEADVNYIVSRFFDRLTFTTIEEKKDEYDSKDGVKKQVFQKMGYYEVSRIAGYLNH